MTGERREVRVETAGGVVRLRFTVAALCALESDLDLGVAEIGAKLAAPGGFRLDLARRFVRAAMVHANPEASLDEAAALMDDVGIVETIGRAAEAFRLAFPQEGGEAGDADPPAAAAGGSG